MLRLRVPLLPMRLPLGGGSNRGEGRGGGSLDTADSLASYLLSALGVARAGGAAYTGTTIKETLEFEKCIRDPQQCTSL